MSATPDLSRRERIMREIRRRMAEIKVGLPEEDPFRVEFGVITRGSSLEGLHETAGRYAMAILDTDEVKSPKIQQMVNQLTVSLEFFAWVDQGEDPSSIGNKVMADVQRKMREDLNLTEPDDGRPLQDRQLSEHVEEVRNQLFIDGYADRKISGVLFYSVTYKHGINDPRILVSPRH